MSADYGAKVSAPGDDVENTTPLNLLFDSEYSTLKVFKSGDVSVSTDGSGNATVSADHNLGYAPGFFVFRKMTAQWTLLDASSYSNAFLPVGGFNGWSPDGLHHAIHAYTDTSKIYVQMAGAAPSTTFNFRYYILVDLSAAFSNSGVYGLTKNYGMKVAKPGKDVLTAQEYDMVFSSKYKAIQHYSVHKMTEILTLPAMFASYFETDVEEGTYVDFVHNLGYAPFFLAFFESSSPSVPLRQVPYSEQSSIDATDFSIASFCDATRVRISFWRLSNYLSGVIESWDDMTITVRVVMFTENLSGATFG